MKWQIYHKDGSVFYETGNITYSGEWMGDEFVTTSIKSAVPIDFAIDDYIIYRNERYVLNVVPTVQKQARKNSYGEAFVYDSVKFYSLSDELTRCRFLDVVLSQNTSYYTGLPDFNFYANSVTDLLDRIKANLDRLYVDEKWTIKVYLGKDNYYTCDGETPINHNLVGGEKNKVVTVSNITCWEALALVQSEFNLNFIVRGREVVVGDTGDLLSKYFYYGKDKGLFKIERTTDDSQQIVTRLRAYGNTTNIPTRYYTNLGKMCFLLFDSADKRREYDGEQDFRYFTECSVEYSQPVFDHELVPYRGFCYWIKNITKTAFPALGSSNSSATVISVKVLGDVYTAYIYAESSMEGVWLLFDESIHTASLNAAIGDGEKIYCLTGTNKDRWPVSLKEIEPNFTIPDRLNCKNLMLPGFPYVSLKSWGNKDKDKEQYSDEVFDPYIDSVNADKLGIREATVFFDGSNDTEDIYPSIEWIKDKSGNQLNKVVVGSNITDNGIFEGSVNIPNFEITIADIGFDINEYKSSQNATISFKDGMCGGRDFTIVSCTKVAVGYRLVLNRHQDSALDLYFPYNGYQIKTGDEFVLLNIEMPKAYVDAAAEELLRQAKEWLSKNDYAVYRYSLTVDEVFMARQHQYALKTPDEKSLHDTIKAGDVLHFEDDDLDFKGQITIDKLEIKEGEDKLPKYTITLTEDKAVGTLQRIQQQIDSIANGGGGGGCNASEIETMIRNHGSKHFLSKNNPDTAKEVITFDKGFKGSGYGQGSNGAGMWKDESGWHIQTDYLEVFNKATFREVEIQKVSHIGGQSLLTAASCKVVQYTEDGTSYKVLFNAKDSDGNVITNNWAINDIAYCQTFNLEQQADGKTTNHYYKYVVKGVGTEGDYNYIILDKNNKADGSDAPVIGDSIVQLGNTTDATRQSAIMIIGAGQSAPSILEFSGINSFALPDPETQIKPNENIFTGKVIIKADSTFEDGTNIKESIDNISDNLSVGENMLRNSGFRGYKATLDMEGAISEETETYSPSLEHWESVNASVVEDEKPISGCAVYLRSGSIVQVLDIPIEYGEDYIISFKGQGVSADFECGGYSVSQSFLDQEDSTPRYVFKFTATENGTTFKVSSSNFCYIYDLMLEKGTVPSSAWKENSHDIPENWLDVENLKTRYLQSAFRGSTEIAGGLILSNLLMLGNDKNEVTAGMNGLYADANSVSHWSGGTLEQAIYTVAKYLNNPQYQPTQEELANMAMFVVTHGGRAILNDVIARGTIYATDGEFTGTVHATNGEFGGYIKTSLHNITDLVDGGVTEYTITDKLSIICDQPLLGGSWTIKLPTDISYVGSRVILVNPFSPGTRTASTGLFVQCVDKSEIIGLKVNQEENEPFVSYNRILIMGGYIELLGIKKFLEAKMTWMVLTKNVEYYSLTNI